MTKKTIDTAIQRYKEILNAEELDTNEILQELMGDLPFIIQCLEQLKHVQN